MRLGCGFRLRNGLATVAGNMAMDAMNGGAVNAWHNNEKGKGGDAEA